MDPEGTSQPPRGRPRATDDPTPEPSYAPGTSGLGDNTVGGGSPARPQTSSTDRRGLNPSPGAHPTTSQQSESYEGVPVPLPPRSYGGLPRQMSSYGGLPTAPIVDGSDIGWIVPVYERRSTGAGTVRERLEPTIHSAEEQRNQFAWKATWTKWVLNFAIGLQVLLGALTTAISAAATTVKEAQVASAVLGGLSTLVASYLARARGGGEPDLSILRVKDLEHFLRDANAFLLDHAHESPGPTNHLGADVERLRSRLEELLGNGSGERKLSSVGITPKLPQP